jgi:hypothetical protein
MLNKIHLVALALALTVTACTAPDGQVPGAWQLEAPASTDLEPGSPLRLTVTGVDLPLADVHLWVDDVAWVPLHALPHADGVSWQFIHPMPVLAAGRYSVALGTELERKTASLAIDVTIPPRRNTRSQAAQIVSGGLQALVDEVQRQLMPEGRPEVHEAFEDVLTPNLYAGIAAAFAEVGEYAATIEAEYLALPEAEEVAFQAFLFNTGLLPMFEELMLLGVSPAFAPSNGIITIDDRMNHLFARALWTLDGTGTALASIADVVTVANVVALLTGGAGLSVALPAKIAIAIVRVIIDSLLPTDLRSVEVHGQPRIYPIESSRWIFWGTFEPQNGAAGTVVSVLDQTIGLVLGESTKAVSLAASQRKALIDTLGRDVLSRLTRFGFPNAIKIGDYVGELLSTDKGRLWRVKTIVNMQAYNLTVGDLALLNPVLGVMLRFLSTFLDWELVSPFTYQGMSGFNDDATWNFDYATDAARVTGTTFPSSGVQEAQATLRTSFYRFKNQYLLFVNLPWLDFGEVEYDFSIRSRPYADYNERTADEYFVQVAFEPRTANPSEDWSREATTRRRTISMSMDDLIASIGETAQVALVLNGLNLGLFNVPDPRGIFHLEAKPGLNTLTITGVTGHTLRHSVSGKHIAIELALPFVDNKNKKKPLPMEPGESYTLHVWTPPAFPAE